MTEPVEPERVGSEFVGTDRPEVLFVCVHNAGRSQLAAALLDHHARGRVVVRSAGSAPADTIHPTVIHVMTSSAWTCPRSSPSR